MNKKVTVWLHILFFISSIAFMAVFVTSLYQSHAIPGLSEEADAYYEQAKSEMPGKIELARRKKMIRGDILDRNGVFLAQTTEVNGLPVFTEDYAYSSVVGTLTKMGHQYGIIGKYNDVLFTSNEGDTKGASMYLTLDADLQKKSYQMLTEQLGEGAIVILNSKTGAILAMASNPSFQANTFDEEWEITKNRKDSVLLPNAYALTYNPGSVLKAIDSTAIIEANIQNQTVFDEGSIQIGNKVIENDASTPYGNISLLEALRVSSNVYFIDRMNVLGANVLNEVVSRYHLGESISLDFTTLKSQWQLSDNAGQFDIAQASIGQYDTKWSPLQAAMVFQAIANDGEMLRPYVIDKVVQADGAVLYSGYETYTPIEKLQNVSMLSKSLGRVCSVETAKALQEALNYTRFEYSTATGQKVGVKTGSAQTGKKTADGKDYYNAWIASYGPTESCEYVVVLFQKNTEKHGGEYMDYVIEIYNWLLQ